MYRKVFDDYIFFSVMLAITLIAEWHYILTIIHELTVILGIKVFRVK